MTMPRSLLVVPMPFADETPCSWLTRLAQMHAATLSEVLAAVGLPIFNDPDLEMMQNDFLALLSGTGTAITSLHNLEASFHVFREQDWAQVFLRHSLQTHPYTAVCRQCLAEDRVPYWRIEWRLKHWQVCPKHYCRVEDRCNACKRRILVFPLMGGRLRRESVLGHCRVCPHCGTDLAAGELRFVQRTDEVLQLVALQRAVSAAFVYGFIAVDGVGVRLPLTFLPRVLVMGGTAKLLTESTGRDLHRLVRTEIISGARSVELTGRILVYRRRDGSNRIGGMGKVWRGTPTQLARIMIRHRFEGVAHRAEI